MVRQADIRDVDSRCWQIVACADNVQRPTSAVRRAADLQNQAVASHQVAELNGMWIRHTLKPEIHIPSKHKWIDEGR